MSRVKNLWGLLIVITTLLFFYSTFPLGTAFEFSGDEGYELMKPFLVNQGHVLYKEIWDDQPPFLTVLLAAAFKVFSPTIHTARLLMAGLGIVFFTVFHELVRRRSGPWCALLATFFLMASPGILILSISVMQEVPAMAMGLVSAWLVYRWDNQRHWAWLALSGIAMAIAVQIKLTAVLVIPAVFVEFLLLSWAKRTKPWQREMALNTWVWIASMAAVFVLIWLTWGQGSLESSWQAHTGVQIVQGLDRPADHKFDPRQLWMHVECIVAAVLGVVLAVWQKRTREIAFPVVLLLTDAFIHTVHRPWWNYYYLHLAVPLAWLGGYGAVELSKPCLTLLAGRGFRLTSPTAWRAVGLVVTLALGLALAEARLEANVRSILSSQRVVDNTLLGRITESRDQTHLMYSEQVIYAFHARIPVPPELAVITLKRFWSGQMSMGRILELLKHYRPEQLLLHKRRFGPEWESFLNENYVIAAEENQLVSYVAKKLRENPQVK